MGNEAGGLETAPSLMALVHEWGLLRRPQHGKGSDRKEHVSSSWPHRPAHPFCLPCVGLVHPPSAISPSPCPAGDRASSTSAVSHLLAGTTLSCYLFPQSLPSARRPAPCQEVSWELPFVLKHLAVRNPTAMQFHYLHAKFINEQISKVK